MTARLFAGWNSRGNDCFHTSSASVARAWSPVTW